MLLTEGYILMHTLKEHNKVINKPLQEDTHAKFAIIVYVFLSCSSLNSKE